MLEFGKRWILSWMMQLPDVGPLDWDNLAIMEGPSTVVTVRGEQAHTSAVTELSWITTLSPGEDGVTISW